MAGNLKHLSLILIGFYLINGAVGWRNLKPTDMYGKPCANGTLPEGAKLVNCDRATMSMVCSPEGNCICAPSNDYKMTEFDPEVRACLPVPTPEDDFRCQTDNQCRVSTYGKYSKCNRELGKCECHADEFPAESKDNICYVVRPEPLSRSMPSCQSNIDCATSQLGNLSRCNMHSLSCECYDTVSNGKNNVGIYGGICVYIRLLGDFCENNEQCRAGPHTYAECLEHSSYLPGEKTCQCPGGDVTRCDGKPNGADSLAFITISTLFLGFVAIKVIA